MADVQGGGRIGLASRIRRWWSGAVPDAGRAGVGVAGGGDPARPDRSARRPTGLTVPWDAEVLGRVRRLHIRARVVTDALMMGNHRSIRTGAAVEFADYQEYAPGMDLRGIDWRAWARTDRWMVKRYQTETELPCTVVVDLSGDSATGAGASRSLPELEATKAGAAITAAATLLYWFSRQSEPVGLKILGASAPVSDLPPRRGRSHLQQCFLALAAARPGGRAELATALKQVGARARRRSLVIVITDGMEEPASWLPSLGAFTRRGADLRVLHLFDRAELRLELDDAALFYSPEGGEAVAVDAPGVRADFAAVVADYMDEVRSGAIRHGAQYLPMATDRPLEDLIRAVVHGRVEPAARP